MTASAPATGAPVATPTTAWHALTPEQALAQQGVDLEKGLSNADADARRAKVGKNTFDQAKKVSALQTSPASLTSPS